MPHDRRTLDFYAREAAAYAARPEHRRGENRANFIAQLPQNATVLDLGCGAGGDARALSDAGFAVAAVDGSPELAREAEKRIGRPVRVLLFEDLDYTEAFDGIWANASLLHVPREGLPNVFTRVYRALKPGGLLYASFKSGGTEGRDSRGRYYNYLNADELTALLHATGSWSSLDLKEGRGTGYDGSETGWVVVFARRH